MKSKFLLIALMVTALFATTSCEHQPDLGDLSDDFAVYTTKNPKIDFANYSTFYIPDTIKVLGSSDDPTNLIGTAFSQEDGEESTEKIIQAVVENLVDRGYTQITDPIESIDADFGVQLCYVEDSYLVTSYTSPYYWGDWWWGSSWYGYGGYGGYGSWYGPGYGYYYPTYATTYNISIGSLLGVLVELGDSDDKIGQMWGMDITGQVYSGKNQNTTLAIRGIDQAFSQSQYIKAGNNQ